MLTDNAEPDGRVQFDSMTLRPTFVLTDNAEPDGRVRFDSMTLQPTFVLTDNQCLF